MVPLRASPDKSNGSKNAVNVASLFNAPLQKDTMLFLQAVEKSDKKGMQMKHADSVYQDGMMNYSLNQGNGMARAYSRGRKSNLPSEGVASFNPTPQNISARDPSAAGWSTKLKNESPLRNHNRNIRLSIEELDESLPEKKRQEKARKKVQAKIKEELDEKNNIRASVAESGRKR